ncbi:hypothetical protein BC938DRAFT_474666 [Jimgerdemannia flammicorona]|uniref:Uncharacterized protein n=1 Tax=Jimgerdemannia flammicorona TaxID=994334 RepID=A0A433Q1Y2_9FUNG|nr:hypothetical protein BC938DRAFT_474666 [Jimgerdemannia flammicorona]
MLGRPFVVFKYLGWKRWTFSQACSTDFWWSSLRHVLELGGMKLEVVSLNWVSGLQQPAEVLPVVAHNDYRGIVPKFIHQLIEIRCVGYDLPIDRPFLYQFETENIT